MGNGYAMVRFSSKFGIYFMIILSSSLNDVGIYYYVLNLL